MKTIQSAVANTVEKITRSDERLAKYDDKNSKVRTDEKNLVNTNLSQKNEPVPVKSQEEHEIQKQGNSTQNENENTIDDKNIFIQNDISNETVPLVPEKLIKQEDNTSEEISVKMETDLEN